MSRTGPPLFFTTSLTHMPLFQMQTVKKTTDWLRQLPPSPGRRKLCTLESPACLCNLGNSRDVSLLGHHRAAVHRASGPGVSDGVSLSTLCILFFSSSISYFL
jgi:hypothetical protein